MMTPGDTMIVFGGVGRQGGTDVVRPDVWMLTPSLTWREIPPPSESSPTPGARYGHGAIYDIDHGRMLVFGGATTLGTSPTLADNDVWSLTIDKTIPTQPKAVWSIVSTITKPNPRFGHVLVYDKFERGHLHHPGSSAIEKRAVMYGGRLSGGLTDEVWTLWIADSTGAVEWRQPTLEMPQGSPGPRARHGAAMSSAWMVTMGGERPAGAPADTVWALDLAHAFVKDTLNYDSLLWRRMQPNPVPRKDVPLFVREAANYSYSPEVFSPSPATWDTVPNASLQPNSQYWYPYLFQLPGGAIFHAGASAPTYRLNSLSGGPWYADSASSLIGGSAVMYRPGKIMKCGTRDTEGKAIAVGTTQWIDFNQSSPDWITGAPLDSGRVYHNLTLLPSGEVLATGGTAQTNADAIIRARYRPILWRPHYSNGDGIWYGGYGSSVPLAEEPVPRNYHSTALLLPDGRVLSAGGNVPRDSATMVSLYCPPYLFNNDGTRATRPVITAAPRVVGYRQSFLIGVDHPAQVSKVSLIRAGSVTHAFNFDQRYDSLSFVPDTTLCLVTATAPSDSFSMPPGEYLLFVLNQQGVPSIAYWVRLRHGVNNQAPNIPCGGGGCPFVDSRTAAGWQVENSVLARSATGALGLDAYKLRSPPEIVNGRVQVRLRENEQEYTTLDQVRLAAVDHPPEQRAFASGGSVLLGSKVPAYRVTSRSGQDVTALVSGSGDSYFVGQPGETLTVEMYGSGPAGALGVQRAEGGGPGEIDPGDKDGEGGTWARQATDDAAVQSSATDALFLGSTGIRIQAPDGDGGWQDAGVRYPREEFDEQVLDSLTGDMRLIFIGRHRLRFIGHIEVASRPEPQMLSLLSATHSRLGDQLAAVATAGGTTTALTPGDTLTLEFAAPSIVAGQVRDWIVMSNGVYSSVAPARQQAGDGTESLPTRFALLQNRPNPFSRTTAIHFELPQASRVRLEIFDLQGRRVRKLVDRRYEAGRWSVTWDQRSGDGAAMMAGVYVYRMQAASFSAERKMILMP